MPWRSRVCHAHSNVSLMVARVSDHLVPFKMVELNGADIMRHVRERALSVGTGHLLAASVYFKNQFLFLISFGHFLTCYIVLT